MYVCFLFCTCILIFFLLIKVDDPFPVELDDDKNSLEYYGIYNGAEILVNEKEK